MHYAFSNISLQSLHDFLISQVMKNMSQGNNFLFFFLILGPVYMESPGRWGNPLRWGNLPVDIISHFNLIIWGDPPHVTSPIWGSSPPCKQVLRKSPLTRKNASNWKIERDGRRATKIETTRMYFLSNIFSCPHRRGCFKLPGIPSVPGSI